MREIPLVLELQYSVPQGAVIQQEPAARPAEKGPAVAVGRQAPAHKRIGNDFSFSIFLR
jgi:hypothetical protein